MYKPTILLTGSSGFIGKNIFEGLHGSYKIYAPTRQELELTDISAVSNFFSTHSFDIVIHCARVGGKRDMPTVHDSVEHNLKSFLNILHCKKHFKKMIYFGSGAEYDKSRAIINISEEQFGQRLPMDQYGFYKYISSEIAKNEPKIVILRLFAVFGKYEEYHTRFISNNICRTIFDLPISVNKNAFFDFLYIKDLIKIVEYFITHESMEQIYNIGSGHRTSLLDIAEIIREKTGSKRKIIIKEDGLANEYTCDISRLKNEIKDLTSTPIEEAITELFYWYNENKQMLTAKNFID